MFGHTEPCSGWLAACKAGDLEKPQPWKTDDLIEEISEAPEFEFVQDKGEWLDDLVRQQAAIHGELWEEPLREEIYFLADFDWDLEDE